MTAARVPIPSDVTVSCSWLSHLKYRHPFARALSLLSPSTFAYIFLLSYQPTPVMAVTADYKGKGKARAIPAYLAAEENRRSASVPIAEDSESDSDSEEPSNSLEHAFSSMPYLSSTQNIEWANARRSDPVNEDSVHSTSTEVVQDEVLGTHAGGPTVSGFVFSSLSSIFEPLGLL